MIIDMRFQKFILWWKDSVLYLVKWIFIGYKISTALREISLADGYHSYFVLPF